MDVFLLQATIYLGAAVIAVPLAARLGLGSVLGYLLAGIVIGFLPGVGSQTEDLRHFAEFGVVVMLFLIGLELEPRALWDMRNRLIGLGGLQIGITTLAVMGGAYVFGLPWQTSLAIGLILALSSTAIVLQTLTEKGLMTTPGGRSIFSVLLSQDIAVIPMLAVIPLLTLGTLAPVFESDGSIHIDNGDHGAGHGAISLVEGLPGWGVTLVTVAAVALVILLGIFATRPVFRYIHHARLREMYTALALLMVVGVAVLMSLVGLSPALGTFLAGVLLANSEFRHELESDLQPFKGLFLGLFFITVGAGINFDTLLGAPLTILAITLGMMVLKGVILLILAMAFGLRGRDRWLFTLGLAQAGEFGFVLISFSSQQNVLSRDMSELMLLVVALSMLITPLLFILFEKLKFVDAGVSDQPADKIEETGTVIIAGIGRFGQVVNRMVQSAGFQTVVLDHDMETINTMRRFGFRGYFGDPTRPDILHAAGLQTAKVLVVALDDRDAANRLVAYARRDRPDLHIVARAYDRVHVYELYRAGANDIVREMFDSSLRAGRYVLENIGLSEFEAAEAEVTFYQRDRAAVRELAPLWKPGVKTADNPEYVARSRELNKELETIFASRVETVRKAAEDGTDTQPASGFQSKGGLNRR
ncbi:cation:proton antiporter [Ponticoccus sp. SC2-23]|uniref:cation:proton antiporter domain-containing protein n=1 Tax=Alexandriicola marinus TaxID=2081710 RepID=UPI000FD8974F|nr:cation:proton antiporter [Alexandriicola marinus]MBM1220852.1 cation:proton antiporter [Ponticoccus sp. SC6-9]MBM1225422.1 cation:proton antiporter [Ponticoccus sp. SC6-15]MBM1227605.1 cation:proton antiporter [Ponticoccus sp. SC6-38]MBM1234757.1 cation:proton antiporter [Ponticoccus sp. SC6-45]MBM1238107.1 cation:proton antiporter [Ponticoccus sp. SC6-49]MBM1244260.1 cation:proton antiporter [Ponticoccus sp. SC2-64]MBM1248281.1 cation:proton antiporter [Ponticoccus sp. SC6-42]MBM1252507